MLQAWYMSIGHLSLYIECMWSESWYPNLLSTVSEFTSSCHALLHLYHEIIFPEINCYYNQKPEQCNRYPSNCVVVIICFSASSLNCNSSVSFLLFVYHWLTSSKGLSAWCQKSFAFSLPTGARLSGLYSYEEADSNGVP